VELGSGKVAVVTGAASGIGLALADAFAAAGCALISSTSRFTLTSFAACSPRMFGTSRAQPHSAMSTTV